MPRKKTIQPMPIEIHQADGMTIDVYPDDDRPIGRGLGNRNQSEDRTTRAISWLADLHLSKKPHCFARLGIFNLFCSPSEEEASGLHRGPALLHI